MEVNRRDALATGIGGCENRGKQGPVKAQSRHSGCVARGCQACEPPGGGGVELGPAYYYPLPGTQSRSGASPRRLSFVIKLRPTQRNHSNTPKGGGESFRIKTKLLVTSETDNKLLFLFFQQVQGVSPVSFSPTVLTVPEIRW